MKKKSEKTGMMCMVILHLLGGVALSENWTGTSRQVLGIKTGRKSESGQTFNFVKIWTTDNYLFTYKSNCPTCNDDGLKAVLSTALTAKAIGDSVRFNMLTPAIGPQDFEIDQIVVGGGWPLQQP